MNLYSTKTFKKPNKDYIKNLDDLNKEHIRQLHNVILSFSSQSTEIKKLFVTVEVAAISLIVTLFKDNYYNIYFFYSICGMSLLITTLFFIVDSTTYFYQDKLRHQMLEEENQIRKRHNLKSKKAPHATDGLKRLHRSIINSSHIIYYLLIISSIIILIIIPHIHVLLCQ